MNSRAPSYATKGIIIGRTNFGEADRMVRFFTPDRGKVSAVAKGIRRIKSASSRGQRTITSAPRSISSGA